MLTPGVHWTLSECLTLGLRGNPTSAVMELPCLVSLLHCCRAHFSFHTRHPWTACLFSWATTEPRDLESSWRICFTCLTFYFFEEQDKKGKGFCISILREVLSVHSISKLSYDCVTAKDFCCLLLKYLIMTWGFYTTLDHLVLSYKAHMAFIFTISLNQYKS